jgi:uncharacterized protein YaaW (UPF0174 family)
MSAQPEICGLSELMTKWTDAELEAFFCCVRLNNSDKPPADRQTLMSRATEELFWAYNSKAKALGSLTAAKATRVAYENMPAPMRKRLPNPTEAKPLHEYAPSLSYEMLIRECCKKLQIEKSDATDHSLLEVYLYEKVMILAVAAMKAEERHMFLTRRVALDDVSVGFPQTGLRGAATTLAALGAAQASGFGIYLGATTALGFVSHAVGVTLPFAVYTGMSSTIAFLIGPVGFLAVGAWLGWNLTNPEWTRITRGLLHIIAMRGKYE